MLSDSIFSMLLRSFSYHQLYSRSSSFLFLDIGMVLKYYCFIFCLQVHIPPVHSGCYKLIFKILDHIPCSLGWPSNAWIINAQFLYMKFNDFCSLGSTFLSNFYFHLFIISAILWPTRILVISYIHQTSKGSPLNGT